MFFFVILTYIKTKIIKKAVINVKQYFSKLSANLFIKSSNLIVVFIRQNGYSTILSW